MPAEIAIRGGTVDRRERRPRASGRRGHHRRKDRGDRAGPARRTGARRLGLRGRPRLHRHPHPLRRPGVLGPGPPAVVVPGGHHRGGRQLRLHHRPDPARAPRGDRPDARERGGHGRCLAHRGHRLGLPDPPRVPRAGPPAGHGAQLRLLHRPQLAASVRDGRRRLRAGGDGRGDRADGPAGGGGDRGRERPGSRPASPTPTGAWTGCRSRVASPNGRRWRRCSWRPAAPARASCWPRPGEQCTYADMYEFQARTGRPFTYPLFALADGDTSPSWTCTWRPRPGAPRSGPRSPRGPSPCSSPWTARSAST